MREQLALKSSIIGLLSKIVTIIFSFVITKIIVEYIGIEVQGINGVFSNVLGFLQLAELGIGTAITYALYQPIVEKNYREIQILMHFYQMVYRVIFVIILLVGVALIPVLPYLVTDTTCRFSYLVTIYLIQLATSASTYLLAYKRNLLYADQKQYISTLIDAIANIVCNIICAIVVMITKNYIVYLLILMARTILANLAVDRWCNRLYPFLREAVTGTYDKMGQLISNVKNVLIGRISGWVYSSTDYLIMSRFLGVVTVGFVTNYYTLRSTLTTIATSILAPIQPIIGNYVRECDDKDRVYQLFLNYTFIRFCIANLIAVGFIVMANPIVSVWLGEDYVISRWIVVLLAVDLFISITHGAAGEFIQVLGLFQDDRNMSIVAMVLNLATSLTMVNVIGVAGVLLGTVIAQIYYWIARAHIVFRQYFRRNSGKYVMHVIKYVLVTAFDVVFIMGLRQIGGIKEHTMIGLLAGCMLCVIVCGIVIFLTGFYTDEGKYAVGLVRRYFVRIGNRLKNGSSH